MRVIQIVGTSGAGKTTFIRELIPHLFSYGRIAIVKHLGHHTFPLEEEKDTTLFFEAGTSFSIGIDAEKAVFFARDGDLQTVLHILSDAGVAITIVEGFKSILFPRIVFGDLPSPEIVLRNPSVMEVVQGLHRFHTMTTTQGQVHELENIEGGKKDVICTLRLLLKKGTDPDTAALERRIVARSGITGVRAGTDERAGILHLLVAVRAVDGTSALQALEEVEGGENHDR